MNTELASLGGRLFFYLRIKTHGSILSIEQLRKVMPMKSRKYNSYAEAFAALTNTGELSYAGREGDAYIHSIKLPDGRSYMLNIRHDGLVTILEPGEPVVQPEEPPKPPSRAEWIKDVYKDGVCTCMAAGRFRWKNVKGETIIVCVKCNRPKYWPK